MTKWPLMQLRPWSPAVIAMALWAWATPARAAPADATRVDFARDVQPILAENCYFCHGPDAQARQGDLRLDTRAGALRAEKPVIVAGASGRSELVKRITSPAPEQLMPPLDSKRALTPAQIDLLKRWIDEGAHFGQHWSFLPPLAQPLPPSNPASQGPLGSRGRIDQFILARLEREGLAPSPEAPRATLIRRVTLDLTGIPPTPEEVVDFERDESPDAYERLVDRLLASPRYGERMSWDWLDAARFADTNGFQGDPLRTMWPWRDWVVRAMNENMPYDQFTVEQLAGDLLPGATREQRLATGFHRNHMFNGEGGRIAEETRVENVFDRTETTGTVWLGLTVGCARCHDHKYDPITRREYYQLFAFFNNLSENGSASGVFRTGQVQPVMELPSTEEAARRAELLALSTAAATAQQKAEEAARQGQPAWEKAALEKIADLPEAIAAVLKLPADQRNAEQAKTLAEHYLSQEPSVVAARKAAAEAKKSHDEFDLSIVRVMVMDELPQPRPTFMLEKGAYNKPGEEVTAGVPASLPRLPDAHATENRGAGSGGAESGDAGAGANNTEGGPPPAPNRLALARWMVDPEHPLTARVAVNRVWQTFFGVGLVKTSEDFGVQGERPSHPELLDDLARDFVDHGWDVKRLTRAIVTSATYRQSARIPPGLLERDPENRLLARGARFRMPSWMLRDQALSAGGLLVERIGGKPVKPYQPPGVWEEATFGQKQYDQEHGAALYRRSVYTFWRRIVAPTMFFDTATRQTCSVRTTRTNTPLHALATLNDVTYVEAARALAQRVLLEIPPAAEAPGGDGGVTIRARLERSWRLVVGRAPSAEEAELLRKRLARLMEQFAADPAAAEKLLTQGESPRDTRLSPVEHASWTSLCLLVMNLDEALTRP